jgi:hypothetical protein
MSRNRRNDLDFVGEATQLGVDLSAENTELLKTLKALLYYVKLSLLLICGLCCLGLFHFIYSSNEGKKFDHPKPVEILPNLERKKIDLPPKPVGSPKPTYERKKVEILPYECKKFDLHPKPVEILPNHPYGLWPGLANKIDLETGETLPGFHEVGCVAFVCLFV